MPTENDLLLQTIDSIDSGSTSVDTRLRIGSPRRTVLGATETDSQIAHDVTLGLPASSLPTYVDGVAAEPEATDPAGHVKRALTFTPRTGVSLTSGGHFSAYLRQSFDVRVLDGPQIFQAVDQGFKPDPAKPDIKPGVSYLRLGAPENIQDAWAEQRNNSGIGIFSDGSLNAATKQDIKLTSDQKIKQVSKDIHSEYNGENYNVGYEYDSLDDDKAAKVGTKKSGDLKRRVISVDFRRKVGITWYQQSFKNNWNIAFNAALKGDVALSASYGIAIGAKIDHSAAMSFATSVSGKAELKLSYEQEISKAGANFKGTAGDWSQKDNNVIKANEHITLKIDKLGSLPFKTAAKVFRVAATASAVAQMAAMTAYNATLVGMARVDLSAGADDDANHLKSTLDKGAILYIATTSLGAATAALGTLLAAQQAKALQQPAMDPLLETDVTVSEGKIELWCGASSITITPNSIDIYSPSISLNGTAQIELNSVGNRHNPAAKPRPPRLGEFVEITAADAEPDDELDALM